MSEEQTKFWESITSELVNSYRYRRDQAVAEIAPKSKSLRELKKLLPKYRHG